MVAVEELQVSLIHLSVQVSEHQADQVVEQVLHLQDQQQMAELVINLLQVHLKVVMVVTLVR